MEMSSETLDLLAEASVQSTRGSVLPLAPVWVIGSPRSGTTWFGRILDSNPALFITEETRVMSMLNRVVNRLAQDRWLLQRGQKAMIRRLGADLPGLVERFYSDLGARPDQRWGDKHPHYADRRRDPECLTLINALFPDSQFIHLIRDGRAVAASFRDLGWGNLEYSAEIWVNHVRHAREFGQTLPPERYLEVRYEDLVQDTRSEAERVHEFLGVPWHDRVDQFLAEGAAKPWSAPTTSDSELGKSTWAERFEDDEVARVLETQGPTLVELGYLPHYEPPPAETVLEDDVVLGAKSRSTPVDERVAFLLVGMARSGTTLLQRLASELRGVWVPQETHFWRHAPILAQQFDFPIDRKDARRALAWFVSRESSESLGLDPDELVSGLGEESYLWDLFVAVVARLAPEDAVILGEKTPDHLRWTRQLLEALPHLHIFGLIRDPRAVFRSQKGVPWGIEDPWVFSEKWLELTRLLADLQVTHPDRVTVFKYEAMTDQPGEVRTRIAQALGIKDEARPLDGEMGGGLFDESEWWKKNTFGEVRAAGDEWRNSLSDEERAIIEYRCGLAMSEWGYPTDSLERPEIPDDLADRLGPTLRAGHEAAANVLPIGSAQAAAWAHTPYRRAARWQSRAEAQAAETKRMRAWVEAEKAQLAEWKEQARNLAAIDAGLSRRTTELEDSARKLESEVASLRTSSASWKSRAEELRGERDALGQRVDRAELGYLRSERRARVVAGEMKRLKARRWWRLGQVLARWFDKPWRVDRLGRGIVDLARSRALPARPNLSDLDERITLRTRRLPESGSSREKARHLIDGGQYEAALETVEGDAALSATATGRLLARDAHIKLGELTAALQDVRDALRVEDSTGLRMQERVLVGRLRETETWWLPDAGEPLADFNADRSKILHVLKESLPFFERGYTMRSHSTLLAQRNAGYEPVVVTSLGFPREQGVEDFAEVDLIDGIVHHRLDLGPSYDGTSVPYDLRLSDHATMAARLAEVVQPGLIQSGSGYRGYETALVGLAVARRLGIPMIYEIRSFLEQTWTAEVDRSEAGEYYRRRFDQEVRCLKDADHVITIADSMKQEIIGRGIDPDKIDVVPNVVDVDRFAPRPKNAELAKLYGVHDRFVLGYISNLGWREGIDNLVRAVAVLRRKGYDVAGLVAGEGPELDSLTSLVAELGLEADFVFTGHIPNDEIEEHYALIDLFVIPRVDDRAARLVTPLKPLEAMAMGLPVIAADLPALRELASPGDRGMVFAPSDPDDLARVAADLITDVGTRHRLAAAGQAWVRADRTLESNTRRYAEILSRALK